MIDGTSDVIAGETLWSGDDASIVRAQTEQEKKPKRTKHGIEILAKYGAQNLSVYWRLKETRTGADARRTSTTSRALSTTPRSSGFRPTPRSGSLSTPLIITGVIG